VKVLDVCELLIDYSDIPKGSVGTIVEIWNELTVEVEFSDQFGKPISADATIAVPVRFLSIKGKK